jgi:radical SAM protein (TIGR01212 family)
MEPAFDWRVSGRRFYGYNFFLKRRFGHRVQKVSIDAGFTCPNVDGTVALGGCNFCDNRSFSPSRRVKRADVIDQIDDGIRRMRNRYEDCRHFLAYFQPATNTYAPVDRLRPLFERALTHPQVVGLAIGTRSDCVPDDVLDLLQDLAGRTYLSVEYGLQSIHDRSLKWMNRGHDYQSFVDAVARSKDRGFEICAHVILGIPGESHAEMMATADEMARLKVDAVKVHNLYAVKRTPLGEQVERGEVTLMERDEYVATLVDFLERIPPTTIVERTSGDAPPDYFIGPQWCLDKQTTRAAIEAEFVRRDTWQGRLYPSSENQPA